MSPGFIYINGFPGVGKLTVARHLSQLIPESKIMDNHHFIDPVAMVYDRGMPEYQPLRAMLRKAILDSISKSQSTKHITWICTDSQSSDPIGKSSSLDYLAAAKARGSQFLSIILTCEIEENARRLVNPSRGGDINGKITDANLLKIIRENSDIGQFGGEDEIVIDTTGREAVEIAREIVDFVKGRMEQSIEQ